MAIVEVESLAQFKELVSSDRLTALMFSATWCTPCKHALAEFERLAFKHPLVQFLKVDVDSQPDVAERCFIGAVPTFVYARGGATLGFTAGADMRDVRYQIQRFEKMTKAKTQL